MMLPPYLRLEDLERLRQIRAELTILAKRTRHEAIREGLKAAGGILKILIKHLEAEDGPSRPVLD